MSNTAIKEGHDFLDKHASFERVVPLSMAKLAVEKAVGMSRLSAVAAENITAHNIFRLLETHLSTTDPKGKNPILEIREKTLEDLKKNWRSMI